MEKVFEGCAGTEDISCLCLRFEHEKEFGCIGYDANTEEVYLMEFNSVEDLADYYGTDVEDWMGIDEIEVGERVDDGAGHSYTRIW